MRYQANLSTTVAGSSENAHLKKLAKHGDPLASRRINEANAPPFPEALLYLHTWIYALHGRSGVGMNGFAPLSYVTIDAWSRLTGARPDAEDVDALIRLDAVLLNPDAGKNGS